MERDMDLEELKLYLKELAETLDERDRELLNARLKGLFSVFPFNEYEYVLMFLLDRGKISFEDYEKLRSDYVSSNKYLELYSLAPRIFGEVWAHKHIMDLDPRFKKPNKSIDPDYNGEYDLWIDGVRVEVKSARAVNRKIKGSILERALRFEDKKPFWMNFQQIKIDVADVFIFIGVWVDRINYWVMSNSDVKRNRFLSHQHRGGIEYQIGITDGNIHEFDEYLVDPHGIGDEVIKRAKIWDKPDNYQTKKEA